VTVSASPSDDPILPGVLIPGFIAKRPEGLFVMIERLPSPDDFMLFVDRAIGNGYRFSRLDYSLLLELLYDSDAYSYMRQAGKELRIAADMVEFKPLRNKLYRTIKMLDGGKRVEYLFEPVTMEVTHQEPVYGEPDDTGVAAIIDYVDKTKEVQTALNFDEFFAAMWLKGVKYGLDEAAICEAIESRETVRRTIARQLEATAGRDAEIVETSPDLHRDNSPKILANGKADLSQFKNRFPQMAKGTTLIRKIPRVMGKSGRKVDGSLIEPKLPKDLDLYALTAAGTKVEVREDGEYVVATLDGFLTLDAKTNQVSVTEKIENKGGISVKTTGDLVLNVDEFIEHGEVQEGRVVKGRNMTFLSDVFGKVISEGGNIHLKKNLSGGVAETLSGDIELAGRVLRSQVRSGDGEVAVKFSESSTLIAKIVRVEHAVSCVIVADEIEAGTLEGCLTVAKKIHIHTAAEHRGKENLITLLIPDSSVFDQDILKLQNDITDARTHLEDKTRQLERLKSDPEFAKFLILAERIKGGTLKITPEQTVNWRKLLEKHGKSATLAFGLSAEIDALKLVLSQSEEALIAVQYNRAVSCVGIGCTIEKVDGQATGQTMRSLNGRLNLETMQPAQIRESLQGAEGGKQRIFSEDSGAIEWQLATL